MSDMNAPSSQLRMVKVTTKKKLHLFNSCCTQLSGRASLLSAYSQYTVSPVNLTTHAHTSTYKRSIAHSSKYCTKNNYAQPFTVLKASGERTKTCTIKRNDSNFFTPIKVHLPTTDDNYYRYSSQSMSFNYVIAILALLRAQHGSTAVDYY